MEQQTAVRTVTLRELWEIFLQRVWIIVLAAVLVSGGAFLFDRITYVPKYESTATLYILRQNESTTASSSDDFSLALKVISDCDYILKSHPVLDGVIEELALDISYDRLSKNISTSNPENTRILEVTVVSSSPEEAKRIVDSICEIGTRKIDAAMGSDQVNLYEYGILDPEPCNTTGLSVFALVGIAAAILAYVIFVTAYLLDDRIRTEEDIERYLGLSLLGDIPNADESKKGRAGYYSAYGYGRNISRRKEEK